MILGSEGTAFLPMSTFAIILNLKPVFIIFVSFCFANEVITIKKLLVILVSFFGATLIVYPDAIFKVFLIFGGISDTVENDYITDNCGEFIHIVVNTKLIIFRSLLFLRNCVLYDVCDHQGVIFRLHPKLRYFP